MKKILIINAHQKYEGFAEGRLNQSLCTLAEETLQAAGHNTQTTIIEKPYDISEEIKKHLWADTIIIQTPVYWFGIPWIFKKYIDETYTTGLGQLWESDGRSSTDASKYYGSGGLLQNKHYMLSTTWNAPMDAFTDKQQFFKGHNVDEVFMGLHKIYQFLGMQQLSSFHCYDVMKNPQIEKDLDSFKSHVRNIVE